MKTFAYLITTSRPYDLTARLRQQNRLVTTTDIKYLQIPRSLARGIKPTTNNKNVSSPSPFSSPEGI